MVEKEHARVGGRVTVRALAAQTLVLLARLPPDLRLAGLPPPSVLAACGAHLRARFELDGVPLVIDFKGKK